MTVPVENKIRLLIVDDHALMREGIRSSLAKYSSLEVTGEAANGEEAVRKAKETLADVILMDINMPQMNGIEAMELLRREVPGVKVLILTVHKNPEYLRKAIDCGASGYVLKDASPEELARAIELVGAGRRFFSAEVSGAALDLYCKDPQNSAAHSDALSRRELEVLKLVASGRSTKEIGIQLKITSRTAATYRERIMRKLGIHNVAGLTRFAVAEGLIECVT